MSDSPPALEPTFTLGLATASALLSEKSSAQLTLRSFRARPMVDFPDGSEADHLDVVAGVAMRFSGALRGTSVFTMEPEGALAWSRSLGDATGAQLITSFIAVAADVVSDLVRASAQAMHGDAVDFDGATLCENSRVAIVIGTHAPGDTAIVTLGFDVEFGGAVYPAHLDLLLEPKLLTGYGDLLDAASR